MEFIFAFFTAWWQAAFVGGILALLTSLFCRFVPRLPLVVRFGAWWLVSAKLLIGLFLAGYALTLSLPTVPVLPILSSLVSVNSRVPLAKLPENSNIYSAKVKLIPNAINRIDIGDAEKEVGNISQKATSADTPQNDVSISVLIIFSIWAMGVFVGIIRYAIGALRVQKWIQNSKIVDLTELTRLPELVRALEMHRVPRVLESEEITSPFVAGLWFPTIVLPQYLTEAERHLALSHELAHLRRGDLWLDIVPTLARLLFWMCPWAHLAQKQCHEVREMLCDQDAMRVSEVGARTYAHFLLQLGEKNSVPPALGMASMPSKGYALLHRRVVSLATRPRRLSRMMSGVLGAVGLGSVLPLSLRATPKVLATLPPSIHSPASLRGQFLALPLLGNASNYSDAFAMSDTGDVVGTFSDKAGNGHAFRFENTTEKIIDLGTFGRWRSAAMGLSSDGKWLAVAAFNRTRQPGAILVGEGLQAQVRLIRGRRDYPYLQPTAVSQDGTLIGSTQTGSRFKGATKARAVSVTGNTVTDLGTLGGRNAHALAISPDGRYIVGKADDITDQTHAFLYENKREKQMRDIGMLYLGDKNSRANAVNTLGQVVGMSRDDTGNSHAFLYQKGQMYALPTSQTDQTDDQSAALGITEDGRIVGWVETIHHLRSAALWIPQSDGTCTLIDANTLLDNTNSDWHLETIRAINRQGDLCGQGIWHGQRQAFLLRVKPSMEPNPRRR